METKNRWVILTIATFVGFSFFFMMQTVPPILPALISEYEVSYTEASSLMFLVALPAVFLSIPAGSLINKHGARAMGSVGLLFASVGVLLSALAPSFAILVAGRFISGIGGAFITTAGSTLVAQWFTREQMATATGIFALNMPIATIISFNILGRIEEAFSWRSVFWISFAVSIVALSMFALLVRSKTVEKVVKSSSGLKETQVWLLGGIWAMFNMAAISYTTWGKISFVEFKQTTPAQGDFLASMLMIGGLVTPLTGYISDRFGRRKPLIMVSALGIGCLFLLVPASSGATLFLLLALVGLSTAVIPPLLFAIPPEILAPERVGVAYGVMNTCLNIGILSGPVVIGLILDQARSELNVFSAIASFAIVAFLLGFLLKAR